MAKNQPSGGGAATQAPPAPAPAAASSEQTTEQQAHTAGTTTDTTKDPAPPAPSKIDDEPAPEPVRIVPENHGNTSAAALDLLDEVCAKFGVDPSLDARPRQLLAWNYYKAQPLDGIPAAVTIVTGGGKKLKLFEDDSYPMDEDTEERLADIFSAYTIDPNTKGRVRVPLPDDLTLPLIHVTGVSTQADHRYQGGYLKSGGKTEAAKRQELRDRQKRK